MTHPTNTLIAVLSVTNRAYDLQYQSNLTETSWVDILTNVPGSGGPLALSDTNQHGHAFYRVRISLP
ncbi:MAG: hypothetical protein JXR37_14565 [Kiritimatiellae bacterium]|nr:hypothetical protein [Kiritimatiellia bacterium]